MHKWEKQLIRKLVRLNTKGVTVVAVGKGLKKFLAQPEGYLFIEKHSELRALMKRGYVELVPVPLDKFYIEDAKCFGGVGQAFADTTDKWRDENRTEFMVRLLIYTIVLTIISIFYTR